MIGSIIGAVTALGSAIAGGVAAKRQQKRQNKMNREMAKYQNDLQLEQWQKENEYNHPSAVMQRLKQAGINPRIAFGSSANSQSAPSPNLSAPEQNYTAVGGHLAQGLSDAFGSAVNMSDVMNNIRMKQAQTALMNAQAKKANEDAELSKTMNGLRLAQAWNQNFRNERADIDWKQRVGLRQWQLNSQISSYLNQYGNANLVDSPIGLPSVDLASFKETPLTILQRAQLGAQIDLLRAKRRDTEMSVLGRGASIRYLNKRIESEKFQDIVRQRLGRLFYHQGTNELNKGNLLDLDKQVKSLGMSYTRELIKMQELQNMDFFPFIGNISDYSGAFVKPFSKYR